MLIDMNMQLPNGVDLLEYSEACARARVYWRFDPRDQHEELQHQYDVGPFGLLRWRRMESPMDYNMRHGLPRIQANLK